MLESRWARCERTGCTVYSQNLILEESLQSGLVEGDQIDEFGIPGTPCFDEIRSKQPETATEISIFRGKTGPKDAEAPMCFAWLSWIVSMSWLHPVTGGSCGFFPMPQLP